MKIKFDIQEDFLYARRAYEQIAGSEDAYKQDPAKYAGQPLAAWPIKSQFDIIRDYNSTTGEETNKIIESTERPWNEREFIRVDWSQNLVTDYVGLGINFFFDDGATVRVGLATGSRTRPSRTRCTSSAPTTTDADEFAQGRGQLLRHHQQAGGHPDRAARVCYEENGVSSSLHRARRASSRYQLDDCASQIVKVRHAFAKISPEARLPAAQLGRQADGPVRHLGRRPATASPTTASTASPTRGFVRHAARFNLWQKSYQDDGKTPIPYDQRELRTIPYYAESSLEPFPPELFDTGQGGHPPVERRGAGARRPTRWASTAPTSRATRSQAGHLRLVPQPGASCATTRWARPTPAPARRTSSRSSTPRATWSSTTNGNPILHARQGDPRRSNDLLGQPAAERRPARLRPAAVRHRDRRDHLRPGLHLRRRARHLRRPLARPVLLLDRQARPERLHRRHQRPGLGRRRTSAGVTNLPPTLSTDDRSRKHVKAMDFDWAQGLGAARRRSTPRSPTAFMQSLEEPRGRDVQERHLRPVATPTCAQVRRDQLARHAARGDDDHARHHGDGRRRRRRPTGPSLVGGGEGARLAAALAGGARRRSTTAWTRCARSASTSPTSPTRASASARIAARQRPGDPEHATPRRSASSCARTSSSRVTLHEVGHNMGLRHNFRASFDAMNYFPSTGSCARRRPRTRAPRGTPASTRRRGRRSACAYTGDATARRRARASCARATSTARAARTSVDEVDGRRPRVPVLVDHGLRRRVQLGPHGPRALRQGGDEVQLRR